MTAAACYAASEVRVALTTWEVMDERAQMLQILSEVCHQVGATHAVIGGIAVGFHSRVRATVDVDLLVPQRKLGPLAKALEDRGFVVDRHPDMIRVYPSGATIGEDEALADLVGLESNPALREAAKMVEPATVLGQPVRIVQRGALVALKFQAATSPSRRIEDRYIDVGDIGRIVRARFDPDDEAVALRIADTMYPGARDELASLLDDLRNDRPVKL